MPDETEHNGRVTLAVVANKIDNVQSTLNKLEEIVSADHDRLGKVESQIDEFVWFKRLVGSYAIGLIVALALGIYAVVQAIQVTHP